MHEPTFGSPKVIRNRYRYRDDKDWTRYARSFLTYLKAQNEPVRELAELAKDHAVCLNCFEADYDLCHRTFVPRAANESGASTLKYLSVTADCRDREM